MAKSKNSMSTQIKKAGKKARTFATMWFKQRYYYGWHFKYSKVDDRVILFESFHGKTVSDSPLYMLMEFLKDPRSKSFRIYYATSKANAAAHRQLLDSLGISARLVAVESKKYTQILATAKYLVNNSSFPAYFTRKPEQRYIQTWHGTPLKTLGKQMRLGIESMYNVQHNFLQANVITFPNEYTRTILMRDYNLENLYTGKAALLGYPRNQVFFEKDKAKAIRDYYGLDDFETFAYMPTWRGANNYTVDIENYRDEVMAFLSKLDSAMRDDQLMFVNFHSMVASRIGEFSFEHIFPFPENKDNYEFLSAMDALITDYSSVFFDYSLTRKPIILFTYDKEDYLSERGMYLDIDELPFPQASTVEELAGMISGSSYRNASYVGSDYEREFLAYDSAENARKALDLLFEGVASGIETIDYAPNSARRWKTVEPSKQQTLGDIRTICDGACEDEIVIFLRSRFNEDKSRLLHDDFLGFGNYVFVTKAYTCTAIEEVLMKRDPRVLAVIEQRERQRVFPNLDVPERPRQTMFTGKIGSTLVYNEDDYPRISAKIRYSQKGNLRLVVKTDRFVLESVLLVHNRNIFDVLELSPEETDSGHIGQSLRALTKNGRLRPEEKVRVFLAGTDRETGDFVPIALKVATEDPASPDDKLASTFHPMWVRGSLSANALALVPYADERGLLSVWPALADSALARFKRATLVSVSNEAGKVRIRLTLRDGAFVMEDFVLRFRSETVRIDIHLPYTSFVRDGNIEVESVFDPAEQPFRDMYWDAFVVIRRFGLTSFLPVSMTERQKNALKFKNQQWRVGENKVLFTHIAKGMGLSFTFRDYYPKLDTYALRIKEFAAYGVYMALHPYWKRKRIWLVYEKYCSLAQDNAFYFFEYCMSLPEEERKHVFYVIDKSKPDYAKLKPYDAQVIDFMSFKHVLYTMVAKLYIASDSRTHLYVWRNKPSIIRTRMAKHKIFFLQHGVTALKQVAYLFGKRGSSPMTYFLTTSKKEQEIVVKNFGYNTNRSPVLGFSRWDVLDDCSNPEAPKLLIMPTWRPWLEEQDDSVFVSSEYFERYSSFIRNPALLEVLNRYNATLRFFIHPKLSEQLKNFTVPDERIELVAQGSEPLNRVMMESSMLITDYSSVCWDMLYMDKPVVFYQFDQELYETAVGSYIDLQNDLPGEVCRTEEETIAAIEACVKRGFRLTEDAASKADAWFAKKDKNNRKRTYNFIVDHGF